MREFTPRIRKWSAAVLTSAFIAFVVLAFVGHAVAAGPNCGAGKDSKAGCSAKSCAAFKTCASATQTGTQATAEEKKPCTKEECITMCMAKGMTKEQAEECWAKHGEGKTGACHADSLTQSAAASGCPRMAAQTVSAGEKKTCTKEECVAKLMASGMSKEEAEKKAATCLADGKCKHESGKGCCAFQKAGGTKQ